MDDKIICEGQYLRQGNCLETERPSGRIKPCEVLLGEKCILEDEDEQDE